MRPSAPESQGFAVTRKDFGKTPGVAYTADYTKGRRRMWGRAILNGTRAYSLLVIADDPSRNAAAETFLESFHLIE